MLVSRETTTENSGLFDVTIYPRDERDLAKTRKLIPKGNGLDPKIYGGYSGNSGAYMVIVKIEQAKKSIYKVIGVPMRTLASLNQAKKQGNYQGELHKVLEPQIMFDNKGKSKHGIKGFRVIKDHVPFKQVVLDGDKKFMLYSDQYEVNAKQLTLSQETMRIVTDNLKKGEDQDQLLVEAYDEILQKVDQYLPLFDMKGFRNGLHKGRDKFIEFSTNDKKSTLSNILNGLHDNMVGIEMEFLGIRTPFGRLQSSSGIYLSPDAKLIYQSPTGLFEKRVRIADL